MSIEEKILENWKNSKSQSEMLINDYSISENRVFLSTTRVDGDSCPVKSVNVECTLEINAIQAAIEKLSDEGREKLI